MSSLAAPLAARRAAGWKAAGFAWDTFTNMLRLIACCKMQIIRADRSACSESVRGRVRFSVVLCRLNDPTRTSNSDHLAEQHIALNCKIDPVRHWYILVDLIGE